MNDVRQTGRRRLLITGATGGMGRVSALLAAGEGYDLILADLSMEKLQALAGECAAHGVDTSCHYLDVTEESAKSALIAAIESAGGVDCIIHTVGLSPQMAEWQRIIDVDLVGTVDLLERLRPQLSAGGCAVTIASMSAYMAPPDAAIDALLATPLAEDFPARLQAMAADNATLQNSGMAYAYSKRALKQLVADSAEGWGKEGKRCVSISPGMIDTEMGRLENEAMDFYDEMRARISLDRLGEAEDIANMALFLLSDKASYITGCDILVDGGFVARIAKEQRQQAASNLG